MRGDWFEDLSIRMNPIPVSLFVLRIGKRHANSIKPVMLSLRPTTTNELDETRQRTWVCYLVGGFDVLTPWITDIWSERRLGTQNVFRCNCSITHWNVI
jgi:hypothetical protein